MKKEDAINRRAMLGTTGAGLGALLAGLYASESEADSGTAEKKKSAALPREAYHHVGVPTKVKHDDERFLEDAQVYITDPEKDPFRIEWCRWLPGSEAPEQLRTEAHLAFQVDDVDKKIAEYDKKDVFMEPFVPFEGVKVAFIKHQGFLVEFLQKT